MLKKDITFIYWDKAEWNMYQPLAEEARRRGYKITLTDNKYQKCEIGFYCQHINYPEHSKFSFIMLHDIIQQYSNWPDIWFREPWNKYDIGILPSQQWEENWNKCSQWYYSRPRRGVFKIGWPKADVIENLKSNVTKERFYIDHGLDINKRTIVYAPAWENDHKQDDFVKSMQCLDVNILIKQAAWNINDYPEQVKNVQEMYELHKNLPNVVILPPATNIFEAIAVSDVLVSEESSTMCEAAMMGIPAVSVSNWLIPDVTPSRYPQCNYDFVIMTTKEGLTNCIKDIITNYESYHKQSIVFAEKTFSNIGKTSSMILDLVDDIIDNKPLRYGALVANTNEKVSLKRRFKQNKMQFLIKFYDSYYKRNRYVRFFWDIIHKIHHLLD